MTIGNFVQPGKASFVFGGQFGSEGKGLAAAAIAINNQIDLVTTNNGPNSGHTSIVNGVKRVAFHLPTATVVNHVPCYLNDGAVIDVGLLLEEINTNKVPHHLISISPSATVVSDLNKKMEKAEWSPMSKIASTQKGVGGAIASKVLRSAKLARDHEALKPFVRKMNLNYLLALGQRVLVEIPQGWSLSVDNHLCYPFVTSRNCNVMQAMSDAKIHPTYLGNVMAVIRTFPIRVGHIYDDEGNITGDSGPHYRDQKEIQFEDIGQEPEFTTVTGRKRRIFTFSQDQFHAMAHENRPKYVFINFMNYLKEAHEHEEIIHYVGQYAPNVLLGWGPDTSQVEEL